MEDEEGHRLNEGGKEEKRRDKKSSNCCGLLHVEDGEGSTRDQ